MIVAIYKSVAKSFWLFEGFRILHSFTPIEPKEFRDPAGKVVVRYEGSSEPPRYVRTPDGYRLVRRYGTCDRLMDPTWIIGLGPSEVIRRGLMGLDGFGMADGPEAAEDCVAAPVEAEDDNPF